MIHARLLAIVAMRFAVGIGVAAVQPPPSDLAALVARTRVDGTIAAWCRGKFRRGRPRAFAAALTGPAGGGRYIILEVDGTVEELGTFARAADLSCYTRVEATKLDATIRHSETIHGHVAPRWNTTVVCGFSEETTAACWQYSPADRAFVKVGEWVT
jgi:hypothetical protein